MQLSATVGCVLFGKRGKTTKKLQKLNETQQNTVDERKMAYTSTRAYSRPLLNEIVVITVLLHSNFIVFVVFSHFAALSRD